MTQEFVLRAMSKNYSPGNLWDALDLEACAKAADEIARLRKMLQDISEFCSGEDQALGAIKRLTAIRNSAEQAIR